MPLGMMVIALSIGAVMSGILTLLQVSAYRDVVKACQRDLIALMQELSQEVSISATLRRHIGQYIECQQKQQDHRAWHNSSEGATHRR